MAVALRVVVLALAAAVARCAVRIELSRAGGKSEVAKQSVPNASVVPLEEGLYGHFGVLLYRASVSVGTPGQEVQVAFSLHDEHTMVPGAPPLTAEATHSYYTPSLSSTYERVDRVLSSSTVEGEWARDVVSLGSMRLEGFEFAVAKKWSKNYTAHIRAMGGNETAPTLGTMGLGFSEGGVPVVLRELVKTEQIPAPIFAFYFGKDRGDLSLGGPAEDCYEGDFHFVSLANATAWSVAVDGVQFGADSQWTTASGPAYLSQIPFIAGPSEIIMPFIKEWEAAGATNVSGVWQVPCETQGPSAHFKIDGRDYTLEPEDLLLGSESTCMVAAHAIEMQEGYGGEWVLGLPFLKKYYTQFDAEQKRIGFALAKHEADNFV